MVGGGDEVVGGADEVVGGGDERWWEVGMM